MTLESAVHLQETPCPLGCPEDDEVVLEGSDRLHGTPGRFTVVACRNCGLMRTNPRPTPESIGAYYPMDYGPYQGTRVPPGQSASPSSGLRKWLRTLSNTRAHALPPLAPGRMLEIGCASGSFIHHMAHQGWEVEGLEFSEQAASAARSLGYQVWTGALESAPDPTSQYDLVVGWMVLEHLHDPVLALTKLHRWVRPGGWLVLSVPNAGSAEFRIFQDAWYALQLPTHLYHYTPGTLQRILCATGWEVDRVLHQRTIANAIASLGYVLRDRHAASRLADALIAFPERGGRWPQLLMPIAFLMSLLGQTGRMTVWARRSHA